jgi:hypothetical protein
VGFSKDKSIYEFPDIDLTMPYLQKGNIVSRVHKELIALTAENPIIQEFINLKIGEILYMKVNDEHYHIKEYLINKYKMDVPDFETDPVTFINLIGESYRSELNNYLNRLTSNLEMSSEMT